MIPTEFPESNIRIGPPPSLDESQCETVSAHVREINGGSCDGLPLIVTAWRPNREELKALIAGAPVLLSIISEGLPPHFLTVDFEQAIRPA